MKKALIEGLLITILSLGTLIVLSSCSNPRWGYKVDSDFSGNTNVGISLEAELPKSQEEVQDIEGE